MRRPEPIAPRIAVSGDGEQLALEGVLDIHTLKEAKTSLKQALKQRKTRALDLGKLSALDTPGALFLCGLRDKGFAFTGVRAEHQALLDLVCGLELKPLLKPKPVPRWRQLVIQLVKARMWRGTTRSTSSRSSAARQAPSAMR